MIYIFSKELYSKESLLKASYAFTDKFYIHLQTDDKDYIVEIEPKEPTNELGCREFKNEILTQEIRIITQKQTHELRILIMARAFSSSVIAKDDSVLPNENEEYDLDSIMKDWFEENE